ncbi:MAG: AI-2E family transporter [Patescibacteria group bacterium]
MPSRFEIKPQIVVFLIGLALTGWLVYQIRDILVLLFVSFIIMAALRPGVDFLSKNGIPRFLAILLMYVVLISVAAFFGTLIFPPLVSQTVRLVANLPAFFSNLPPFFQFDFNTLVQQITPLSQNVARFTVDVFSNILTVFTIAVFTFYFLLERNNLRKFLDIFVGDDLGDRLVIVVKDIEERLGAWVRGQLLLALIIGLASYLGLFILGISYVLPLALIAGILEMVPIIGPIISAIPAIIVALTVSPGLALAVAALYIIIQQLENNLIVPTVMHKVLGMPPLAILLALMVGGRLGGVVGIILAVPVLLVIQTVVGEFTPDAKKLN